MPEPKETTTNKTIWLLLFTNNLPPAGVGSAAGSQKDAVQPSDRSGVDNAARSTPTIVTNIVTDIDSLLNIAKQYRSEHVRSLVDAEVSKLQLDTNALSFWQNYQKWPGRETNDLKAYLGQIAIPRTIPVHTNTTEPKRKTFEITNLTNLVNKAAIFVNLGITNLEEAAKQHIDSPTDVAAVAVAENIATQRTTNQLRDDILAYVTKNLETNPVPVPPSFTNLPPLYSLATNLPDVVPLPITIISPLIDSEVFDLASSVRSQNEFALALSFALRYAGLGAQANAFEQFVKNNQFDIRTRNAQVAVNAFSSSDGKFGFQIGARLSALGDPSKKQNQPSRALERQSFPALLILQLGAADIQPLLRPIGTNGEAIEVFVPVVKFSQMRRWTPLGHGILPRRNWFLPINWFHPPFTEERRLRWAAKLCDAEQRVLTLTNSADRVTNSIVKRIQNLESQMVGGEGHVFLAAKDIVGDPSKTNATVAISGVYPDGILLEAAANSSNKVDLVIAGSGLDQISLARTNVTFVTKILSTAGLNLDVLQTNATLRRTGQVLFLSTIFTRTNNTTNDFAMVFQLQTTNKDNVKLLAPPVNVRYIASRQTPKMIPALRVTQANDGAGKAFDYTVAFRTNALPEEVTGALAIIKADLEKNKPDSTESSNNVMSILVNGSKGASVTTTATGAVSNAPAPPK